MREVLAEPPAAPAAASWAAASVRALHPVRWGLGLAGLAATVSLAALAQSWFDHQSPRFAEWFTEPANQARAFGDHLTGRSVAALVVRLGLVAAVVLGLWGLIGGWIARHELLARQRGQPFETPDPIKPGPTRLVARRVKDLVLGGIMVLILCALLLLPVALAGGLNHLGGVGAILVAVLLPVVLLADLVLLLLLIGLAAWPLMPVTIAAEYSDHFDGLSRAYNYLYMRPVRFTLLLLATLALSTLPLAGTLFALAGSVENWPSAAGHPVIWIAGGLSASLFWSLQTLTYLHLRTAVDTTDANELAGEPDPEAAAPAANEEKPAPAALKRAGSNWLTHVWLLGLMVMTWAVTALLFARFGGEDAGWLGWGMGERFRPPAEGLYGVASLLAGVWGAIWVTAPIAVAVRRALRRDGGPPNQATGG